MVIKTYLRVAKTTRGTKVAVSNKPSYKPIIDNPYQSQYYPTVAFALVFDIPDKMFEQAERVLAEIKIPEEAVKISAEVEYPEKLEGGKNEPKQRP